ncbi:MAG: helix-hairpin-helix domain-containing protein [Tannerellaceae bacterium]|jgi:hypothetical protein|nr:helix-hairpin-helix domain-containing protein [Tannerellaceae bacterium]
MKTNWKNLLYFSKGERRALSLITLLISIGALILSQVGHKTSPNKPQMIVRPDNAPKAIYADTSMPPPADPALNQQPKRATTTAKAAESYAKQMKYPKGTKVEINTADTTSLKMIPGIASFYAKMIADLRDRMGGFYSVEQLMEVYKMNAERYDALKDWFYVDSAFIAPLFVNYLPMDSLAKHPYVSSAQALAICSLRRREPLRDWDRLTSTGAFTTKDKERLQAYFSFYLKE